MRIVIEWPQGQAKIDVYKTWVDWKDLHGPGDQQVMDKAHDWVRDVLKKRRKKIAHLVTWADTKRNRKTLMDRGDWVPVDDHWLVWEI